MAFNLDDRPRPTPPAHEIGQDLSALSVHELEERIARLQEEIARLEAAKAKKLASRDAAQGFFKT
jgi:uncharacterized small protein (DUF1192 family)